MLFGRYIPLTAVVSLILLAPAKAQPFTAPERAVPTYGVSRPHWMLGQPVVVPTGATLTNSSLANRYGAGAWDQVPWPTNDMRNGWQVDTRRSAFGGLFGFGGFQGMGQQRGVGPLARLFRSLTNASYPNYSRPQPLFNLRNFQPIATLSNLAAT